MQLSTAHGKSPLKQTPLERGTLRLLDQPPFADPTGDQTGDRTLWMLVVVGVCMSWSTATTATMGMKFPSGDRFGHAPANRGASALTRNPR